MESVNFGVGIFEYKDGSVRMLGRSFNPELVNRAGEVIRTERKQELAMLDELDGEGTAVEGNGDAQ